jgi:hypothetical protein
MHKLLLSNPADLIGKSDVLKDPTAFDQRIDIAPILYWTRTKHCVLLALLLASLW